MSLSNFYSPELGLFLLMWIIYILALTPEFFLCGLITLIWALLGVFVGLEDMYVYLHVP